MMVLDLRPFDIVESVGSNELFKLVPNSFGNPDSFENPRKNFVFPTRYFEFSHTSNIYDRTAGTNFAFGATRMMFLRFWPFGTVKRLMSH